MIKVQVCEHCEHWSEKIYRPFTDGHTQDILGLWGSCEVICHGFCEASEEGELAMTMDGSDYQSYLQTRKNFGCVMWEFRTTDITKETPDEFIRRNILP